MSSTNLYDLVREKDDPEAYQSLVKAYLEWVLEPECDKNSSKMVQVGSERRRVTFMRDDSIGDPREPGEADNEQEISRPEGTDIFFPVYYMHSSIGESDGQGGTCKDIEDCIKAAKYDLSKIHTDKSGKQMVWAKIGINGKETVPIVSNFNDHTVTVSPFTITVGDHQLKREPEFQLKPGTHEGAVLGTFMYLRNFKKGDYVLHFGGEASNFVTHSKYTMHVK